MLLSTSTLPCEHGLYFEDLMGPNPVNVELGDNVCLCGTVFRLHGRSNCYFYADFSAKRSHGCAIILKLTSLRSELPCQYGLYFEDLLGPPPVCTELGKTICDCGTVYSHHPRRPNAGQNYGPCRFGGYFETLLGPPPILHQKAQQICQCGTIFGLHGRHDYKKIGLRARFCRKLRMLMATHCPSMECRLYRHHK
uniref:Uncharacterized protein n=1 Tax=Spongospora subterranea TaxID=70186 RepID=A0A0H5QT33_9EUKA|eukprot:CRZ04711.1 hypothetical protein [Spongospora subterranea]